MSKEIEDEIKRYFNNDDAVAPIQSFIRREVQKQLASLPQTTAGQPIRASEYDFKCEPANMYPGDGWEFVALAGVGINIILVWKMSRIRQAELKIAPVMPLR